MVDSKYYIHNEDKIAFKTLQSIPGFSTIAKYFMDVMFERQFLITNMSSNVKISEKQLPEYYDMLPPICEKLGIEIPDMYLDLTPEANAYTYGDKKPFIVLTTALLDSMPMELIPSIIAHECGHIACHHTLYSTMGRFLLNSSSALLNATTFGSLVSVPLQIAFFHWMRCSELSADRAATIADGGAEKVTEVCMRLAGYREGIGNGANIEEFINQAYEYREMITNSKWNKTLEFMLLLDNDHPLAAVRALEASEWVESETFKNIINGNFKDIKVDNSLNSVTSKKSNSQKLNTALEISNLKTQLKNGKITQEEYYSKLNELLN